MDPVGVGAVSQARRTLALSAAFCSESMASRTAVHDEKSAGAMVTAASEKSRTLICVVTCALTIGMTVSYSPDEIFTRPSGIIATSPSCSRSAFSEIADTRGWSAATRQKRRADTSCTPFSERLRTQTWPVRRAGRARWAGKGVAAGRTCWRCSPAHTAKHGRARQHAATKRGWGYS